MEKEHILFLAGGLLAAGAIGYLLLTQSSLLSSLTEGGSQASSSVQGNVPSSSSSQQIASQNDNALSTFLGLNNNNNSSSVMNGGTSASATTSNEPTINVYPNSFDLTMGSQISISGSGFSPNGSGYIFNYEPGYGGGLQLSPFSADNTGNFKVVINYNPVGMSVLANIITENYSNQNYFYLRAYDYNKGEYSNYVAVYMT